MATAYQRVAEGIRSMIQSGDLAPGTRLPSEHQLMRDYGVSRNTVRQALAELQLTNLVDRRQGKGTFVAMHGVSHVLGDLRSFTDTLLDLGKRPGIGSVSVTLDPAPPPEATEFLPGTHIWVVQRVRTADDRPFSRMQSWLPDALASEITAEDLTQQQSLYAVLRERLEIQPKEATEIIRSEPAGSEDARLLGVPRGTSLLCIYRWTTDQRGAPMEYVRSAAPGDRYQYVIKLHQ